MRTVMVVDDDLMLADTLEELLVDAGYDVCGIAVSIAEAVELGLRMRPELAVIDLRLENGELGTEIARVLRAQYRLGVLYATGNSEFLLQCSPEGEGCLIKPFNRQALLAALDIVIARVNGDAAPAQLPRGFSLLN